MDENKLKENKVISLEISVSYVSYPYVSDFFLTFE